MHWRRGLRLAAQVSAAMAMTLALWMIAGLVFKGKAGSPQDDVLPGFQATRKFGLSLNDPRAFQGYTLLAPMSSTTTYLIDMQGQLVHKWDSSCLPAESAYFLEQGHLFRTAALGEKARSFGGGPGAGGRVQEFTWAGELVWDFKFSNDKQLPHHDMVKLPSGNVLMIVWDKKTAAEAIAAGRRPQMRGAAHLLADSLIEVKPTGKTTGAVVWEWHAWDHLIQDHDGSRANYGEVAAHPERININFGEDIIAPIAASKDGLNKLRSIGYVGSNTTGRTPSLGNPDWTHFNGVAYNADLDQIIVTVHSFSEFWIIDHSTTTAQAASHHGGRSGRGGDLLFRWGNPRAYRAGTPADQRLFAPHNAHWIPPGLPGGGHVLVFNNGGGRPGGNYSSVDELVVPVDAQGRYLHKPGTAFGPDQLAWSYTAPKKWEFLSLLISGAQRLPNGNTLICSGEYGIVFEVTPANEVVWKYENPVKNNSRIPGRRGADGLPGFGPLGALGGRSLFRAYRYAANYPGLVGKDLRPGKSLDDLQQEPPLSAGR